MKRLFNRIITFMLAIALTAGIVDVNTVKVQAAKNSGVSMNVKWDYSDSTAPGK